MPMNTYNADELVTTPLGDVCIHDFMIIRKDADRCRALNLFKYVSLKRFANMTLADTFLDQHF